MLCAAMALAAGCTEVDSPTPGTPTREGSKATLTACRMHIITRAGDETELFDPGTTYLLYAQEQGAAEWLLNGTTGTETDGHTIAYSPVVTFSSAPISFYGITYGTTTAPTAAETTTGTPTIHEAVAADGTLPDLMFSNNLKGCAPGNNRLQMNFRHAFSQLQFRIVKQDESADAAKRLEGIVLKSITVGGTRGSGTLDIAQGSWSYSSTDKVADRTYYETPQGISISTTPADVGSPLLVFPNLAEEAVSISVTLSGFSEGEEERTVKYALQNINEQGEVDMDNPNFRFAMNHRYTLIITVLKDDVRTIAIAPQVYEWEDVDTDSYLGQPVTFANLMWMDRNLGAQSADCEIDWENCRGYYYQYARNLPYILDKEKYEQGNPSIYNCLYTYNQYGEKVYGMAQAGSTLEDGTLVASPNIAINPGDEGIYNFIRDKGDDAGIWLYDEKDTNQEDPFVDQYWTSSPDNHPCPKGWRLPTKEEFALFLPEKRFNGGNWYTGYASQFSYIGNILGYTEDEVHGTINGEKAIYLIKRKGRPDCYRIRILLKESKTAGKSYYEFAYFPGDASMSFDGLNTAADFEKAMQDKFDWSMPTAVMQIPACGFIYTSGGDRLSNDGESVILRSTDRVKPGWNWVCYLRVDFGFGLSDYSRKALGDQIRCVRDIDAQ